jgi:AcrR family transcriptional regulator
MRPHRGYHHGDLANALIRTALAMLPERGIQALSLREVARRAGVSHSAAYRHFADKEALLARIATQGFERLTAMMRAAKSACAPDPLRRLRNIGLAYVEFGRQHPHHLQIMFGGQIGDLHAHPELALVAREAFDELAGTVREGRRCGAIRNGDERTATLASWALVHGLAMLLAGGRVRLQDPRDADSLALSEGVVQLLQTGLIGKNGD